jgi:hypothetical protein
LWPQDSVSHHWRFCGFVVQASLLSSSLAIQSFRESPSVFARLEHIPSAISSVSPSERVLYNLRQKKRSLPYWVYRNDCCVAVHVQYGETTIVGIGMIFLISQTLSNLEICLTFPDFCLHQAFVS